MIDRYNIISTLGDRQNAYHSAILTCYNFDPIFFEEAFLPVLRKLGVTNIIVVMDAFIYDELLSDERYSCHRVDGVSYTLVRKENSHGGVFHSKIMLLAGDDEGAVIIGSGNLTYSGQSHNEEVWNAFHVEGSGSSNYPLFRSVWAHLAKIAMDFPPLTLKQMDWMEKQSPWIGSVQPEDHAVLESGETAYVLTNDETGTILTKLKTIIADDRITEMTVMAPFYDRKGEGVKSLIDAFRPDSVICILDLDRQSAPYALLDKDSPNISFFKYTDISHPLHAKIVVLRASDHTWVLSGSANIGNMALGTSTSTYNDETCVLLRNPISADYISELGILDKISPLVDDEKKIVAPPEPKGGSTPLKKLCIHSAEYSDGFLSVYTSGCAIEGELAVLNKCMEQVNRICAVSGSVISVALDSETADAMHIVVFMAGDEEISNRSLITNDTVVESFNPDPKSRELGRILDGDGVFDNLENLLGFIAFDDEQEKNTHKRKKNGHKKAGEDDGNEILTREQFFRLKDSSELGISLHPGVRILNALKEIFFSRDFILDESLDPQKGQPQQGDPQQGDPQQGDPQQGDPQHRVGPDLKHLEADAVQKLQRDILGYLNKMDKSLCFRVKDKRFMGQDSTLMYGFPELKAELGLNSCSSLAVACCSVAYFMVNHRRHAKESEKIFRLLMKDAELFFSLYRNSYPMGDTNVERRCRQILQEAEVFFLLAIAAFFIKESDSKRTAAVILNSFDMFRGRKDELRDAVASYKRHLSELDQRNLSPVSTELVSRSLNLYLSTDDVPLAEMTRNIQSFIIYRNGYGFFYADSVSRKENKWVFKYHHARMDLIEEKKQPHGIFLTKFKGFKDI